MIDGVKCVLYVRIYFVGYVLDVVMICVGLSSTTLTSTKGVYESALAYVEYKGKVDLEYELVDVNVLMV